MRMMRGVVIVMVGMAALTLLVHHAALNTPTTVMALTTLRASGTPGIVLYDLDARQTLRFTPGVQDESFLAWSASGDQFAFSRAHTPRSRSPVTVTFNLETGQVSLFPGIAHYATFSPDGRWLTITRMNTATDGALLNLDTQTGDLYPLTPETMRVSGAPAWSPDGQSVLFGGRIDDGSYQIYRYDLGTSDLARLTDYVGNNYNPRPSPDGRMIAFQSFQRRSLVVMLLRGDDPIPRSLTAGDGFCELPAWSPDSTRVAVICQGLYGTFGKALFIAYVDSRDVDFIAADARAIQPQWTRDGGSILFVRDDGYLYRVDAPAAPIEGTSALPPTMTRAAASRFFFRETYVGVGVRP
jgi:hypothetical protein